MADDLFAPLTDDDRKRLFDSARRQSYHRGDIMFHQGEVQPNLYVVRRGLVRVDRKYAGSDVAVAVARYGPGEILGEVAFLQRQSARGSAVAEEDVEADVLEGGQLRVLLELEGFASRFYLALALCLAGRLLNILPGIKLPEAFGGGGRSRLPRTGQLSERQLPDELTRGVADFRAAMQALAAQPPGGPAAQQRVNHLCDDLVKLLTKFTEADALVDLGMDDLRTFRELTDLERGVGGYVNRETFPVFMQAATIALGFERPRGYAEDREVLERIERNDPEGDGRLGPAIDQWFLGRPLCQARRNSLRRLTAFLQQVVAGAAGPGPVRLTSLAAGTAREVFDLLDATQQQLFVTCIDADADALLANGDRAKEHRGADRITWLQANLSAFLQADRSASGAGSTALGLGPQHAIYGLGVCDYLNDEQVVRLLDWAHGLLIPGGRLLLTNRATTNADRAFAEHILDWPVVHRTADEFGALFADSRFGPQEPACEEAGVNLFAECRKS